ncbi:MAG: glycosyltransferase [Bacteroidetes bacterium]|nr:glycosyltransferase [Bacteroidota bacterium]
MVQAGDGVTKPILLALGIHVPGYSFTRVLDSLFAELSAYYTIHWSGIGYKGPVQECEHYTLHPSNVKGGDIYGAYGIVELAGQLQPQTILLLNDFYLLRNYSKAWLPLKQQGIKLVAYVPLDGLITDVQIIPDCFFLDELVLYHEDAVKDVETAVHRWKQQQVNVNNAMPKLHHCYHGVDTVTFTPPSSAVERSMLKQKIFTAVDDAASALFMLNGNRFNERKDIASTIEGFAKLKQHSTKPVYLCLHTPNLDAAFNNIKRPELMALIANSGCAEYIIVNPFGEQYVTDEALVQLYQACEVGINTSFGEGWGMISFEHAACGAAQVVPGHTAPAAVWKNAGIIIPATKPVQLHTNPFLMHGVDTEILAEQLLYLVNDTEYLHNIAGNCYQHVLEKEFQWKTIASQWQAIL